jgi:hypothetical protein
MTTPALTPLSYLDSATSAALLNLPYHATSATAGRGAESSLCLVRGKSTQETLSIPAAARCSLAFQIPLVQSLRQVLSQLFQYTQVYSLLASR